MHEAVSCDRICLDPSRLRIADQPEPTGEVEREGGGGAREREEDRERMHCKTASPWV